MSRLKLRAQTWLAPSVPFELHSHALAYVAERLDIEIDLRAETRWSGPPPDEVDPFSSGEIDLGFFCAPSYLRLAPAVRLVSAAPLFADPRVGGSPVYYSEIVVRRDHPAKTVRDLAGSRWAFNDSASLSGYFSILDALEQAAEVIASGSHMRSLELVREGRVDAAAIDSTVIARFGTRGLRIVESRGPWPVQPMVARAGLPDRLVADIAGVLRSMHEDERGMRHLKVHGVRRWAPVSHVHYRALRSYLHRAPCLCPSKPVQRSAR